MKNKLYLALVTALLFVTACKKGSDNPKAEPEPKPEIKYSDSLYFKIGDRIYQGKEVNIGGVSNGKTNIKPFKSRIVGRELSYETGGMFWYGDVDSTYYGVKTGFNLNDASVEIIFTKKMLTTNLLKDISINVYQNNEDFFKIGKRSFATDYEMENSTEGVVLEVSDRKQIYKSRLTSSRPGFSIFSRPDIGDNIQKDSKFEILKVINLSDDIILIQAKFELNLFDAEGEKYKLTEGFYQKKVKKNVKNALQFLFINS